MSAEFITINNLNKEFVRSQPGAENYFALDNLHLEIMEGEFICLLGPSGCGKTTLLEIIAGFEKASSGKVGLFQKEVTGPGRDRGVVFQSDRALFPWLTVEENIAFGLKMRKIDREQQQAVVEKNLALVGLTPYRHNFPHELSGGMKQRVQIARILANDPQILLMDEPFGALDAQTRQHMQQEVSTIWSRTGKTIIFITHDISEAIFLADRIGIMTKGPRSCIKRMVTIPLPRPRDHLTTEFIQIFNELNDEIEKGVQNFGVDKGPC